MRIIKAILKIITVVTLLLYPLFFNLLGGAGLVCGAVNNYRLSLSENNTYHHFLFLGIMLLISSVLMTVSTVLCFRKKNLSAVITEATGLVFCLIVVFALRKAASDYGISDDISFKPYQDIYTERHLPTLIHSASVFVLSAVQKNINHSDA